MKFTTSVLDECITLWGKLEQGHMRNIEHLYAHESDLNAWHNLRPKKYDPNVHT